ncbi:PHD finger domain protein [Aspergillus flavus AF70]|nr:PHD finger domain protein [Aspergillus flavus AF70]
MSSAVSSSAVNSRQSVRQTRTNPSRTSKTLGRSSFAYGHGSLTDTPPTPPVAHGFYPALTHFTDAITALPREFRRHNSLLKEVDAKAWALEDNLQQLLKASSELQADPPLAQAPDNAGVLQEDLATGASQAVEPQENSNRRYLLGRVRQTLQDLMMTADEKNHVISNANDELDRQLLRLDTIFPFIAGEISDEARLGSLTHWAYSNRNAVKTTTNERPRREAASNKDLAHALHEAEVASRSEARREAVLARKQRRTHADSDFDDARASGRKGQSGKARGAAANDASAVAGQAGASGQTKRRKVERPPTVDTGAAMERSASGAGASGRAGSKDATDATKKRSRAPNANAAGARKRNNTAASAANSPVLAPSPLVGAATVPRSAASPGPNAATRPQSSRAQQNSTQTANGRQRPSSSASNRVANNNKTTEAKTTPKDTPKMETFVMANQDTHREMENETTEPAASKVLAPVSTKREDMDGKPAESIEPGETPAPPAPNPPAPKGRSSKTSTPVMPTFSEPAPRVRPTRSTDAAPAKRSHKKNGSVPVVQQRAVSEEEESYHEGDDEDEEGEPRYCYCNEISFGEMVACDNDACPREWFHLSCVGLTKPPGKNVKWYCNECKDNMRRSRSGR